ncbi:YadA-like family protein [Fusobacterium nucleatum]
MKKSVSLKLIVFSFLLAANVTYSAPEFQAGSGTDSTEAGVDNEASGDSSSAFGYRNTASDISSSAFGFNNIASGYVSSAFGYQNKVSGSANSAFGYQNKASGSANSAFGYQNKVSGNGSSAFGFNNAATGMNSSAVGANNKASGKYSSAFGYQNTASGENSSVVGSQYKVTGEASGAFGDPNVVTGNGSYAFGNDNNIAGDNNFVLGNNVNIGAGIQNSVALGNNSTVSSSNEVSVGSATQQRKITNVADGDVSATSTDAVTGKQLYKVMQNSGTTGIENLRNEVNEKIDDVKNEVNHVGSLSAALAGLHPMQYDPKAPAQVMAALGHYRNKQSVAVGLSYYFNDRFMMSAGVAIGSEKRVKSMANVGFTVKLGKGSGVTYNEAPQYAIQDEVKRLTVENNKQAKENQELKERVKKLEEKLEVLLKNK